MAFELNEKEKESLKEAIDAVKVLYGQDVDYKLTYCFTPTGIGDNITIIIKVGEQKFEKDITDYGSW